LALDAPTLVEVTSSVSEVIVAIAALGFALLLARQEAASRKRIEQRLDELTRALDKIAPAK
jgi:hypothetical protein